MNNMSMLGKNGHRKRLRERFIKNGFRGFSEHEIVELLLTLCIARRDVKDQAKSLLARFSDLNGIFEASPEELIAVDGIGESTAVSIKIVKDLTELRIQSGAEKTELLNNCDKLVQFWEVRLRRLNVEVFYVAYVDSYFCLLKDGIIELEQGICDRVNIYPRKILEIALKLKAKGIILAHNHPSGDARPSDQDEIVTRKIKRAADCLDIKLIDHIIISKYDTFSFREHGLVV